MKNFETLKMEYANTTVTTEEFEEITNNKSIDTFMFICKTGNVKAFKLYSKDNEIPFTLRVENKEA